MQAWLAWSRTVFSLRIQACILITLGALSHGAHADGAERCISRQHNPTGVSLSRTPAAIHGLTPQVILSAEGHLKLVSDSSDCCSATYSPIGDLTTAAGPYDPASRRLYLWGPAGNGWIEVEAVADTWILGESGTIEPKLHEVADNINYGDYATMIERSEILGLQFYSGYTAPHWLTGGQSYRVYQFNGAEETRVTELEAGNLDYLGDDLVAGLAVFAPAGVPWGINPERLVWYDGTGIVAAPHGLPPPTGFCR